jgi:hypothetical protein
MKLEACISDADVLIKLCKAGVVHILPKIFTMVKVPQVVPDEVERKTPPERYHVLKDVWETGYMTPKIYFLGVYFFIFTTVISGLTFIE